MKDPGNEVGSELRTQFSRALLLMQLFSACTRISKNKHTINRAIILFIQHPHYLC